MPNTRCYLGSLGYGEFRDLLIDGYPMLLSLGRISDPVLSEPREIKLQDEIKSDDYIRWATQAGNRVRFFSENGPLRIKANEVEIGLFDLRGIVRVNPDGNGTTIHLDDQGIRKRGELVGMGGFFVHPQSIGAKDADEVVHSWNWMFSKMTIKKEDLEAELEGTYIMTFLGSGIATPVIFNIASLALDLKRLDDRDVATKEKITEANRKIGGNVRAFNRFKDTKPFEALVRMLELTHQLSDMSAESRLALVAKTAGMDIKIGRSPDLMINDVRVEVKFDRKDRMDVGAFVNKVKRGISQGGMVLAIQTGDFESKKIQGVKLKWFPATHLQDTLRMAIQTARNGRRTLLLYAGTSSGYLGKVALVR